MSDLGQVRIVYRIDTAGIDAAIAGVREIARLLGLILDREEHRADIARWADDGGAA